MVRRRTEKDREGVPNSVFGLTKNNRSEEEDFPKLKQLRETFFVHLNAVCRYTMDAAPPYPHHRLQMTNVLAKHPRARSVVLLSTYPIHFALKCQTTLRPYFAASVTLGASPPPRGTRNLYRTLVRILDSSANARRAQRASPQTVVAATCLPAVESESTTRPTGLWFRARPPLPPPPRLFPRLANPVNNPQWSGWKTTDRSRKCR